MAEFNPTNDNNKPIHVTDTKSHKQLTNILEAISKSNTETQNSINRTLRETSNNNTSAGRATERAVSSLAAENRARENRGRVASLAAERRNRAVDAALQLDNQKRNKSLEVLKDTLKDGIKELGGILKSGFASSLKSIDDLTRSLRKEHLSTNETAKYSTQVNKAKLFGASAKSYGINISDEQYNQAAKVAAENRRFDILDDEKALYNMAVAVHSGIATSGEELLQYANASVDSIKAIADSTYSNSSRLAQTMANIIPDKTKAAFNSLDERTKFITESAKRGYEQLGASNMSQTTIAKLTMDVANQQAGKVNAIIDPKTLTAFFGGRRDVTTENIGPILIEEMRNIKKNGNFEARVNVIEDEQSRADFIKLYDTVNNESFKSLGLALESEETRNQRKSDFTENGKITQFMSTLTAGFDVISGGLLSKVSAFTNEIAGSDGSIEKIVTAGFSAVLKALNPFGRIADVLTGVAAGPFLNKLKSIFKLGPTATGATEAATRVTAAGSETASISAEATRAVQNSTRAINTTARSTFAKIGSKVIPGIGLLGAVGGAAVNIMTAINHEVQPVSSSLNSPEFKKAEAEALKTQKNLNIAVAGVTGAIDVVAGAVSCIPGIGTAAGVLISAVGSGISIAGNAYSKAKESEVRAELMTNSLSELKAKKVALLAKQEELMISGSEADREYVANQIKEVDEAIKDTNNSLISAIGINRNVDAEKQLKDQLSNQETQYDNYNKQIAELQNRISTEKSYAAQEELKKQVEHLEAEKKSKEEELVKSRAISLFLKENTDITRDQNESIEEFYQRVWEDIQGDGLFNLEESDILKRAREGISEDKDRILDSIYDGLSDGLISDGWDKIGKMDDEQKKALAEQIASSYGLEKEDTAYIQQKLEDEFKKKKETTWYEKIAEVYAGVNPYKLAYDGISEITEKYTGESPFEIIGDKLSESFDALKEKFSNIKEGFSNTFNTIYNSVKQFASPILLKVVNFFKELLNPISTAKNYVTDKVEKVSDFFSNFSLFADGGIVNNATPAVIGEAGKEAVLPLTNPQSLANVISELSSSDKRNILKALINDSNIMKAIVNGTELPLNSLFNILASVTKSSAISSTISDTITDNTVNSLKPTGVPGDDPSTIEKILSYAGSYRGLVYDLLDRGRTNKPGYGFKKRKEWYQEALSNAANQEGRELIKGTYAEKALEFGVSQLGKPYILNSLGKIGYVCNELVNACLKASGFDTGKFRINGVKATFANIQKGKYSGDDYPNFRLRPDLTPETALPGMVFFQDSRKNKEGGFQPGHIGLVYYGHQKLHSSGGSSDYTKEGFLPHWQTPCRGVTVTPFDSNSYMIGEFPGLFEQINGGDEFVNNSEIPFGPTELSDASAISNNASFAEQKRLAKEAIDTLLANAGADVKQTAAQYAQQAYSLLNGSNSKEVLNSLSAIIKYLRDIANSPSNKKPIPAVSKPSSLPY